MSCRIDRVRWTQHHELILFAIERRPKHPGLTTGRRIVTGGEIKKVLAIGQECLPAMGCIFRDQLGDGYRRSAGRWQLINRRAELR